MASKSTKSARVYYPQPAQPNIVPLVIVVAILAILFQYIGHSNHARQLERDLEAKELELRSFKDGVIYSRE